MVKVNAPVSTAREHAERATDVLTHPYHYRDDLRHATDLAQAHALTSIALTLIEMERFQK